MTLRVRNKEKNPKLDDYVKEKKKKDLSEWNSWYQ